MRQIETVKDIDVLLEWIGDNTQKPNLRFYRHVFLRLYAEGRFEAVHVDVLVRLISQNRLWSDQFNKEVDTTQEVLRDRFARRIRWMNDSVIGRKGSPYSESLAIVYDRSSSRYQMVTDPQQVQGFRSRKRARRMPSVDINILSDDLHQALPKLQAESELEIGIRSSIDGYIHVFHRDADGHVDKLFPELGSELSFKVSKGKELFFPEAINNLCKLKCWSIGVLNNGYVAKQYVLVVVSARNIEMSVQDAIEELFDVTGRPINIERMAIEDLTAREKLSAVAEYWLEG